MGYLNQILSLPYASWWIPGLVFLIIVGGFYLVARRGTPQLASVNIDEGPYLTEGMTPLGTPTKARHKEQRQSARRQGNPLEVYFAHPDYKHEPDRACVIDRSLGGMRLTIGHEVDVGVVVSIRPVLSEVVVPWLELEVRSCTPSADRVGEFELGCKYVKNPPYSLMMLYE